MTIDPSVLLGRLGLDAPPPSVAALGELHRRFVETVPYENLDIVLGRPPSIDPATSIDRIEAGRGGYCYHLNGAFAELITALGYSVTRHIGGVQGPNGAPHVDGNHLALTVRIEDATWLVDVGLSDCLHEPLPLVAGEYRQGPFRYRLAASTVAPGGWRLEHDPRGSFVGMDFAAAAATIDDFAPMHAHLSGSPDSPFVRTLCVARRDAEGAQVLRSLTLARIGERVERVVLADRQSWWGALEEVFGLAAARWSADDQEALWQTARRQHEDFLAAKAARAAKAAAAAPTTGTEPVTGPITGRGPTTPPQPPHP